jgi:hypothetical protein
VIQTGRPLAAKYRWSLRTRDQELLPFIPEPILIAYSGTRSAGIDRASFRSFVRKSESAKATALGATWKRGRMSAVIDLPEVTTREVGGEAH